ncbi:hypothetical protein KQX54_011633 [Cotesia glomerata]|uniref:Uncharacterized protein n=1 Tax=Cotesia glomerata TaxID=32391 RepID=A0AAV7I8Q2_COTGL|nr:hypothetical protein KQX54_011633 [Cotesia glomerata]
MWITVRFDGWRDNSLHSSTPSPVGSDIAVEDFSFEVLLSERETGRKLDNTIDLDCSEEPIEDNPAEIMAYCTPKLREGDRETFIFKLASRLSGMVVGSMRAFMKSATTIDGVIEKLRQNFGRTEDFRTILNRLVKMFQEENESVASNRSAEQRAYRVNDLNAAALKTLIVGLKQQLSYAVSNREPETLENRIGGRNPEGEDGSNEQSKKGKGLPQREGTCKNQNRQDDSRQDKDRGQASFKGQDNFNEGVMIRTVLGVTTIDDHMVIITTLVTIKLEEGIATITEDEAEATIIRTKGTNDGLGCNN